MAPVDREFEANRLRELAEGTASQVMEACNQMAWPAATVEAIVYRALQRAALAGKEQG